MPLPVAELTRRLREAADLAAEFAMRAPAHDRDGSFPVENLQILRAAGWAGLAVPSRWGGWGAGLADAVRLLRTLGGGCGSTALSYAMHVQTLGTAPARQWSGDAWPRLCADVVARGAWVNSCASEPELGSPSRGGLPRTVARPVAEGWLISGRKNFASLAPALDWAIVPAALAGEDGAIGRFLVPMARLRIEETWDAMGMRGTGSHDLILEDAAVGQEALLYRESAAAPGARQPVAGAWFTLCFSAVYLGVADAALAGSARYALDRVPTALGKPIGSLEAVQRRLGAADLGLRVAGAFLERVAGAWDLADEAARLDLGADVVAAKLQVAEAAVSAVDHCLHVLGGPSMRRDLPLERRFRDVRAVFFHPPTQDQGLALLGRLTLAAAERDAAGAAETGG
ncbi:MAG TPA: acyl-CoA dehydrogenase family protein [Anaerolineae bacterium]|nr:acyl-CoA dehydrogenase family protein [Anaerolineae bacterium]